MVQIDFFCFLCCFHLAIKNKTDKKEKQEESKERKKRKIKSMLYPVGCLQSFCKLKGDTVWWD